MQATHAGIVFTVRQHGNTTWLNIAGAPGEAVAYQHPQGGNYKHNPDAKAGEAGYYAVNGGRGCDAQFTSTAAAVAYAQARVAGATLHWQAC